MITVNGEAATGAEGLTVSAYLQAAGYDPAKVVVERNREIVYRKDYEVTRLRDGDHLEILRFVGGG